MPVNVTDLTPASAETSAVWEFTNDEGVSEEAVAPVLELPAKTLVGRVVLTRVALANGERRWAMLANVDTKSALRTRHFLACQLYHQGAWLVLRRYQDPGFDEETPGALARALGLEVADVFPIRFDISHVAIGDAASLIGVIDYPPPEERLSQAQLMQLVVDSVS